MAIAIRLATPADLDAINAIYNHYVLHSTCTYQEVPSTFDERAAWFQHHGPGHPVTVATADNQIVGWGALGPFHSRSAFRFTVENSVYVDKHWHRRGVGSAVLADLLHRAKTLGHRQVIAAISADQQASLRLHERLGFLHAGRLKSVGFKFGRWLDVVYMQCQAGTMTPSEAPANP